MAKYRLRQFGAHDLSVCVSGQSAHANPGIRNHVFRQPAGKLLRHRPFFQLLLRLIITAEMLRAAQRFHRDSRLAHVFPAELSRRARDLRLDLAGFNAKAAQFDHIVRPPQKHPIALRRADSPVAGAEPAPAVLADPFFPAQLGQAVITARHEGAGNQKLTRLAGRGRISRLVRQPHLRIFPVASNRDDFLIAEDLL